MFRLIDLLQQHRKLVLGYAGVLILNVALFFLGAQREISLYRDASTVLQQTRSRVRAAGRHRDEVRRMAEVIRQVKQRMAAFFSTDVQPLDDTLPQLTGSLYDILAANRMEFSNVTYTRKPELKGKVHRMVVHVPVKATYRDLLGLIRDLEALPFPAMLERISVSSVSGVEISATVDIVTFYKDAS